MVEPTDKKSEALLGDLESIRTLLDDAQEDEGKASSEVSSDADASAAADAASDVPMLDDVVDEPDAMPETHPGALTEDLFESLMGDGWKSQADEVLEDARATIDQRAQQWSPEDTDELNAALRVRIDDTIYRWLQTMLAEHIDDLRAQVLDAMTDEIKLRVKEALGAPDSAKKE